MRCRILEEFDYNDSKLALIMASKPTILEKSGEAVWARMYKDLANQVRNEIGLDDYALCIARCYDKEGIITLKSIHVAVFDYHMDEHVGVLDVKRDADGFYIEEGDPQKYSPAVMNFDDGDPDSR